MIKIGICDDNIYVCEDTVRTISNYVFERDNEFEFYIFNSAFRNSYA